MFYWNHYTSYKEQEMSYKMICNSQAISLKTDENKKQITHELIPQTNTSACHRAAECGVQQNQAFMNSMSKSISNQIYCELEEVDERLSLYQRN